MSALVLVADDEAKIVSLVRSYLEASGFRSASAANGSEVLDFCRSRRPDCVILDINMPAMDGLSVARELRRKSDVPIIFLTARADETDRIVGLELGADDYVVKPFSPRELVARVRAVLRRGAAERPGGEGPIVRGDLVLDRVKRQVSLGQRPVALTSTQFDLLALLADSPGRVWTRDELLDSSFGEGHEGYDRTIDAHIKNIRKALGDDPERPQYVETVRGVGYRFLES